MHSNNNQSIAVIRKLGMVDSGASDIFICKHLSDMCNYTPMKAETVSIDLADGEKINGIPTEIMIQMNGNAIKFKAFIVETLGDDEIVLGRSSFDRLNIRISIPMSMESTSQRFVRENELHVTPSTAETAFIHDDELKIFHNSVDEAIERNNHTKMERCNHPIAQSVRFRFNILN